MIARGEHSSALVTAVSHVAVVRSPGGKSIFMLPHTADLTAPTSTVQMMPAEARELASLLVDLANDVEKEHA